MRLNQEGYFQSNIVPGLWKHRTRNISFVLVVNDFRIRVLERHYDVTVDHTGKEFVKIELNWDYKTQKMHLSMQPYHQRALKQFNNTIPIKREDSPYPHTP